MNFKRIAEMLTEIESRKRTALRSLASKFSKDSFKRSVCFTGPAGVGKSSLISKLILLAAKRKKIVWLACDPSSMLSGGSLLGDRIRLSQSEIPKNVFIRSLSTRSTQAFSPAVRDMEVYLESLFDEVWVETAGSGQTQQEVTQISGLSILILQPETGDEIQWMKSGVRELADLFVVHKCDLPGASTMMQSLIENGVSSENILLVSSKTGAGLQELMDLIERKRTNTTWKSKLQAIHLAHARALFLEKALSRELKKFEKVKRAWANKPYR